jgi:cytoskeletal protein RodZ
MNVKNDFNHPKRSRSLQRAKRRKTNIVLNSLIIIVVLLIIIVASVIFLGGGKNDKKSSAPTTSKQEQHNSKNTNQTNNNSKDNNNVNNDSSTDNSNSKDNSTDSNTTEKNQADNTDVNDNGDSSLDSSKVVSTEGNDANIKKTYVDPNWAPVGTSQTGGHEYSSDENSPDWKEKEKALSYATGLSPDNMTLWYLGRSSTSSDSVEGTVTSKKNKKVYRVYLNWVDGQGWKPTKVEELKANDRH